MSLEEDSGIYSISSETQTKGLKNISQDGNEIHLMNRGGWDAQPRKGDISYLKHPLPYVIITHTVSLGNFNSTKECTKAMKQLQDFGMTTQGFSDIGSNFLIGNDGIIYEGRGWNIQGATALGWNDKAIGMGFIGTYVMNDMPSQNALQATKLFLQHMVDNGILTSNFTIYCLRQVRDKFPDAPGDALFSEIQTWKGKGPNKWSWRDVGDSDDELTYNPDEILTEMVKMNILSQLEALSTKITAVKDILNCLEDRKVITRNKREKLLRNANADEKLIKDILIYIISGKKEWMVVFLEALLNTQQRLIAKSLWRSLPKAERRSLRKPLATLKEEAPFRDISLQEITFNKPHGTDQGKYTILGAGSYGTVLLASYVAVGGAKVAVKRIKHSEYGGINERDLNDFKKEARTMYKIRHPCIVNIYGTICDTEQHVYGIVMEYMEVGSLYDLLSKILIPWPVKIQMLRDAARGLKFLNTLQPDRNYSVTHCDVKAKNILLNDKFSVKISDFGEALLQNITSSSTGSKSIANDPTHGTVTHMAPELLFVPEDGNYDPNEKTDVWSFGITMFEVCAENANSTSERRTPFPRQMKPFQIATMLGMKKQSPFTSTEMKKVPGDCPPFLTDLMKGCCNIDRHQRLTFTDVLAVLEKNYDEHFVQDIHKALIELHRMYEKNVLQIDRIYYEEDNTNDDDDYDEFSTSSSVNHSCSDLKPSRKSRVKELEELKTKFSQLQNKLTEQSIDIHSIKNNVEDVSKAKEALKRRTGAC